MGWTVRIISILVGVAVLGFFAWWALPPFQISVVWGLDPVPRPRFIHAPPQPPKPPAPKEQARVTPPAPQPPPQPPKPEPVAQASLPSVPPKPETAETALPEPPTQSTPTPQVAPVSAPASEPPSPHVPAGLPPAKPETEAPATPPSEPSPPAAPQAMTAEAKMHLLAPERAEQERFATLEQGPAITPGLQTKRYFGVKVRDGETLEVGAPASAASGDAAPAPKPRVIQLADIVVPEMGATCLDKDGLVWACGAEARGTHQAHPRPRHRVHAPAGQGDRSIHCAL